MGYTTNFQYSFILNKPLKKYQIEFLKMFSDTRRMQRDTLKIESLDGVNKKCLKLLTKCKLPLDFYCGTGFAGQDHDASITDFNCSGMFPGLWCHWAPNDEGTEIAWNGCEKFYEYIPWIKFLISNFLKPWGYVLNGEVTWEGEDRSDVGTIIIKDNVVTVSHS